MTAQDVNTTDPPPLTDDFHAYLTTEYKNIAEAHFRTIEAISSFFRYYLLIMSVPIALLSGFVGLLSNTSERMAAIDDLGVALGAALILIALVGLTVFFYIVNLRMDVILYARTVNSIRKHFYDQAEMGIDEKLRMRVLPQSPLQPSYYERAYFWPVVAAFALLDTFYIVAGLILVSGTSLVDFSLGAPPEWVWFGALTLLVHFVAYRRYADHREYAYLRSRSIGVDIDGVLNKHQEHFCQILMAKTGQNLDPDSITTIPLHDDPSQGVTRDSELTVFNSPEYWSDMPPVDGAAQNLKRIRNSFGLEVRIFSWRPSPDLSAHNKEERRTAISSWREGALRMLVESKGPSRAAKCIAPLRLVIGPSRPTSKPDNRLGPLGGAFSWLSSKIGLIPVSVMTSAWLSRHGFEYDALTIELGNENVSDPEGGVRNRFNIAREKKIRFFVEDDAEKAAKLAFICDVVFLLEQPYNKEPTVTIPNNVIRCKSWNEIYMHIRRLS